VCCGQCGGRTHRGPHGAVVGPDGECIAAPERRSHGFGGGPKHVHVRVVDRLYTPGGRGVDKNVGGGHVEGRPSLRSECVDDLGHEKAEGAELGHLDEVGGRDGHADL
jgi:hypothetical protein